MARHEWQRHPDSETLRRPFERIRVCTKCGAEQTWTRVQSWGRVKHGLWYPRVGRCTGKRALA